MKEPASIQYTCTRCKNNITENDEVLVLKIMLQVPSKLFDFCPKCTKDFYKFVNEITTQRQYAASH